MTTPAPRLYDAQAREKRELVTAEPNHVRMYVCGVTTYDLCHIGHARVAIFFDVVARYLRLAGYRVTHVSNITDIDDKIIKRANEKGVDSMELANTFAEAMHEDYAALGVALPDHEPRATGYIDQMITMIETLISKGHAYQGEGGDVYFDVASFKDYGQLSGRTLDEMQAGARVEVQSDKRSEHDFVLWKMAKAGEPSWASPWGEGRPGWHIECSAMSTDLMGMNIDIHGGGVDLKFPHHENETAQAEAACSGRFVNHWLHVGHVQVNHEKMSKSLGNFTTIRDMLADYQGEDVRLMMLQSHYRHPLDYQKSTIEQARKTLARCYRVVEGAEAWLSAESLPDEVAPGSEVDGALARYHDAMCDDFNTPQALTVVFELVKRLSKAQVAEDQTLVQDCLIALRKMVAPLGILQMTPVDYASWKPGTGEGGQLSQEEVDRLMAEREAARAAKDWARADAIRETLLSHGITPQDQASSERL